MSTDKYYEDLFKYKDNIEILIVDAMFTINYKVYQNHFQ